MAKDKYEVIDFASGGFFVHGGSLHDTYFQRKEDAELVCDALNLAERLKIKRFERRLNNAFSAIEDLQKALREEHIGY